MIFQDLKNWLRNSTKLISENDEIVIQLRDQLCAGFFLIYCTKYEIARDHLFQVKELLVPEYFEALNEELDKRNQTEASNDNNKFITDNSSYLNQLKILIINFCSSFKEFALNLLEKMKLKNYLLVNFIKSNSRNFLFFCQKLLNILLKKLRIIV